VGPNPTEPASILTESDSFIALNRKRWSGLGFKTIDGSELTGDSVSLFKAALPNPRTRDPYERKRVSIGQLTKLF
jgi:hypothetical protein